jgi:hypothetical protein
LKGINDLSFILGIEASRDLKESDSFQGVSGIRVIDQLLVHA